MAISQMSFSQAADLQLASNEQGTGALIIRSSFDPNDGFTP